MRRLHCLILLPLVCGYIACSGSTATSPVSTAAPEKQKSVVATERVENRISIDTTGCLTVEDFDRTATTPASAVPGCIDLDYGTKVVGPLEVKVKNVGGENFEYARIEVPGNGERWTSLAHLATGRDYYRRELNNLLKK